jgi:hypothetical protein
MRVAGDVLAALLLPAEHAVQLVHRDHMLQIARATGPIRVMVTPARTRWPDAYRVERWYESNPGRQYQAAREERRVCRTR